MGLQKQDESRTKFKQEGNNHPMRRQSLKTTQNNIKHKNIQLKQVQCKERMSVNMDTLYRCAMT